MLESELEPKLARAGAWAGGARAEAGAGAGAGAGGAGVEAGGAGAGVGGAGVGAFVVPVSISNAVTCGTGCMHCSFHVASYERKIVMGGVVILFVLDVRFAIVKLILAMKGI